MQTFSCQSGSNGNCIFVQAGRTRLLIDAGISGRAVQQRLTGCGQDARQVDAILLSHNHNDHVCSAGVCQRRFGMPIYITPGTLAACEDRLGNLHDVRRFQPGESFEVGEAVVHTIPTPHDGADGVCFVIEHNAKRLGILTDLGFVFPQLQQAFPQLDAVYLESNYDPEMLREGPYPAAVQQRIRGNGGHLANAEAGKLLRDCTDSRLQWAALAHLSEHNNTPDLAVRTVRRGLRRPITIHLAGRWQASAVFEI
ncbi:MAG: MBL fold metallo-hydrolase [Planctomycetes bacterium]|nr:MBL fold metallo-hydrolase [Planctomycetota bacterium]